MKTVTRVAHMYTTHVCNTKEYCIHVTLCVVVVSIQRNIRSFTITSQHYSTTTTMSSFILFFSLLNSFRFRLSSVRSWLILFLSFEHFFHFNHISHIMRHHRNRFFCSLFLFGWREPKVREKERSHGAACNNSSSASILTLQESCKWPSCGEHKM